MVMDMVTILSPFFRCFILLVISSWDKNKLKLFLHNFFSFRCSSPNANCLETSAQIWVAGGSVSQQDGQAWRESWPVYGPNQNEAWFCHDPTADPAAKYCLEQYQTVVRKSCAKLEKYRCEAKRSFRADRRSWWRLRAEVFGGWPVEYGGKSFGGHR